MRTFYYILIIWIICVVIGLMFFAGAFRKPPQFPPRNKRSASKPSADMDTAQRILDDDYVDTGRWTRVTKPEPPR